MLIKRSCGVLMHMTSLPSKYLVGDLGPEAYAFADFLDAAGQKVWQVLPFNVTHPRGGYSPYDSFSAFAGNWLWISPEELCRTNLMDKKDLTPVKDASTGQCHFDRAVKLKRKILERAFAVFSQQKPGYEYQMFLDENHHWLDDYSLFCVLKDRFGKKMWSQWPKPLRDRDKKAIRQLRRDHREEIEKHCFVQFLFRRQYDTLKDYCRKKGIFLFGDLPIYVSFDSADVWANPHLFQLDRSKKPTAVSGVPPDYFSRTGQLWGNPLYDWKEMQKRHFDWWVRRLEHNLKLVDYLRIDHFRGLEAYWAVPYGEKTAINGRWEEGPGYAFFDELYRQFARLPIIAEDLGKITPGVRELAAKYSFPGMRVLQFGFNGKTGKNIHLPHEHVENSVVYVGTHDNDTVRGWWDTADRKIRAQLSAYTGRRITASSVHQEMMRLAMSSVARLCILTVQDLLGLGAEARMNTPARKKGNWGWRMKKGALKEKHAKLLREMCELYGRE